MQLAWGPHQAAALAFPLTEQQRKLLAQRSEETGKPWNELLDELLARLPRSRPNGTTPRSLYDALNARGMIGTFDGPGDLSTNPKHMEGFGEPRYGTDSD